MSPRSSVLLVAAAMLATAASPALAQGYGSAGGIAATIGATASPPVARGALTGGPAGASVFVASPDPVFATGSIRRSERGRVRMDRH